jgi:hypothetical protein
MSQIPLQTTGSTSDPYVSMSDEAEYARHRRTEEYNPTDDVQHFMDDFGAR